MTVGGIHGGGQQLGRLLPVVFVVAMIALFSARPSSAQAQDEAFRAALAELREASFPDKEAAIGRLVQTAHAGARQALVALLEDRLYFRQADGAVFIVKSADAGAGAAFELVDPLSSSDAGTAPGKNLQGSEPTTGCDGC